MSIQMAAGAPRRRGAAVLRASKQMGLPKLTRLLLQITSVIARRRRLWWTGRDAPVSPAPAWAGAEN